MDKTRIFTTAQPDQTPRTATARETTFSQLGQEDVQELEIGSVIKNRFVLETELGRGGMGVVYKVRDLRKEEAQDRNPFVALKILSEEFRTNPDSFIALQRESKKSQELAHPNIVTVYDFDRDGGQVYMTMEFMEGKPLSVLLKEHSFDLKSLHDRWQIIKQIAVALAYAHEKNIIHLDLKPGNIFVKKDNTVKVLDFGIARAVKNKDQTQTAEDMTVFDAGKLGALTPSYASCEMLENEEPDFSDDVYSLACVAYEVLTGRHPFNKIPATHARFNKMSVEPVDGLTKKQLNALKHALQFKRKDRTATVNQFLAETNLVESQASGNLADYWKWTFALLLIVVPLMLFAIKPFLFPEKKSTIKPIQSVQPVVKKVLTEQEMNKVDRILEAAEIHQLVGRFSEPTGANAMDAYNQVLEIDPYNEKARQGLEDIANYYEKRAKDYLAKGNLEITKKHIERGLLAYPNDPELLEMREKIASE